jgi:large repetitive protein
VTYVNTSDNPSGLDRTVTIIANDGAANSTPVTDTIHVTPVDDAPVTSAGGTLSYLENQIATAIDPTVTVSDVDSANMASATVKITGNYVNGQDVLGFTTQNGITGSFDALTGTMNLTGSSSLANYQAALDSVTYFNSSDNPSGADRTVSYTVNDGTLDSNISASTIHVTPVNDAPVVTFGAITGFSEPPNGTPAANSTPVTIAPNLTISDAEGNNLTSATFVLTDLKPSDALSVSGHAGSSGDIGGIHFDISSTASTETVTLTGTDTIAHYNAVLDLVQFNNTSENPDTTARAYTVTAIDDGGTANGGNNTGTANTTETVTAVDDAPTASVPADSSIGTAFSHTNLAISGLSVADVDSGSGNVTATISANNASLTFNTAGLASFTNNDSHTVTLTGTVAQVNTALATLTYNSDDGFTGSDAVTLNVNDNGHTGTGGPLSSGNQTFHVGVVPQVFYIDNSAGGSANLGTQADPFTSIAAFNTANPAGSGDYVVLEHGTGTYSEANGINLANGVNLIGGSQTLQFTNPVTSQVVTANVGSGTDPTIKLTAGSADNAIDLLAGTTGHTIAHVNVDTTLGSGMGISDDGNNVGTVAISNIVVNTASGTGISFTHGGTVNTTGTNSISSTSGTALDVENTTIGPNNLTFQSISSGSASNSSADGIILVNTGTSGGLHVTGVGTTASSGGTIQHKTGADGSSTQGAGIFLNNTKDVELADMQLNDFSNFAIRGNSVTGFTLDHTVINGDSGTSNSLSDPLASFANVGEDAIRLTNLLGSGSITNSNISGGYTNTILVENNTGTLNRLTIDHSTIGGRTDNGTGMNDGINFQADTGSTAMNLTVTNSALTTARANLIAVTNQPGTQVDAKFDNNTLTNNHPLTVSGGTAVDFAGLGGMTFDISNNTFDMHAANGGTGIKSHVIEVNKGSGSGTSTFDGTIAGNTIGVAGTAHSGSGIGSNDIDINSQDNGTFTLLVQNNILTHYDTAGIQISQIAGSSTVNATVVGNTTSNGDSNAFAGLYVVAGSGLAGDSGVVNLKVGGTGTERNDFSNGDPANGSDVFLQVTPGSTSTMNLTKGVSSSSDPIQVVKDNNLNPSTTAVATSGTINLVSSTPPLPLLAAPGGVQASSPTSGEMHLTQSELDSVVAAAIAQWAAAGASASEIAALHATTFSVADLSGSIIGEEFSPAHITVDTDAAGHGWFIDPTPSDNFEFTHALNAAGTDLLTDPTNAAAGHLDLLTTVSHEMGHVLGLPDSTSPSAVNDLMYISLVDGERRLPDAVDVAQANATSQQNLTPAVSIGPATAPAVAVSAANVTLDAGHGGGTLVGTSGSDTFRFANVDVHAATPPPITHVADYSFAQGDTFDFSALTSPLHASSVSDALVVRALEDPSGSFATLQVNTGDCSLGLKVSNWVNVAQIDGAHAGDQIDVLVDSQSAVHHAQIHVDLLV